MWFLGANAAGLCGEPFALHRRRARAPSESALRYRRMGRWPSPQKLQRRAGLAPQHGECMARATCEAVAMAGAGVAMLVFYWRRRKPSPVDMQADRKCAKTWRASTCARRCRGAGGLMRLSGCCDRVRRSAVVVRGVHCARVPPGAAGDCAARAACISRRQARPMLIASTACSSLLRRAFRRAGKWLLLSSVLCSPTLTSRDTRVIDPCRAIRMPFAPLSVWSLCARLMLGASLGRCLCLVRGFQGHPMHGSRQLLQESLSPLYAALQSYTHSPTGSHAVPWLCRCARSASAPALCVSRPLMHCQWGTQLCYFTVSKLPFAACAPVSRACSQALFPSTCQQASTWQEPSAGRRRMAMRSVAGSSDEVFQCGRVRWQRCQA